MSKNHKSFLYIMSTIDQRRHLLFKRVCELWNRHCFEQTECTEVHWERTLVLRFRHSLDFVGDLTTRGAERVLMVVHPNCWMPPAVGVGPRHRAYNKIQMQNKNGAFWRFDVNWMTVWIPTFYLQPYFLWWKNSFCYITGIDTWQEASFQKHWRHVNLSNLRLQLFIWYFIFRLIYLPDTFSDFNISLENMPHTQQDQHCQHTYNSSASNCRDQQTRGWKYVAHCWYPVGNIPIILIFDLFCVPVVCPHFFR